MEYDYIITMFGQEKLTVKMTGSWDEAYEVARNYHIHADVFTISDGNGNPIITLTKDQLMNEGLKITYTP